MTKKNVNMQNSGEKETLDYGFYSNVLQKPFERLDDLKKAEYVYFEEQKLKEDKAAQKKADAKKVEETFKTLNAARKEYREKFTQLAQEYAEELESLKKAFELGKKDIRNKLADAEAAHEKALKDFTTKYESYHMTLKDGDFEKTISKTTDKSEQLSSTTTEAYSDLFKWVFGL
jgi:hypothetical protein